MYWLMIGVSTSFVGIVEKTRARSIFSTMIYSRQLICLTCLSFTFLCLGIAGGITWAVNANDGKFTSVPFVVVTLWPCMP
jgi:hypothetical protein